MLSKFEKSYGLGYRISDEYLHFARLRLKDDDWNKQEVINEINMENDVREYKNLDESLRFFITATISFFSSGDDGVIELIYKFLRPRIKCPSWSAYEVIKQANEVVHSETYAGIIDFLIDDPQLKEEVFSGLGMYSFVLEKLEWCRS